MPSKEHTISEFGPILKKTAQALRTAEIPFLLGGSVNIWAHGGSEAVGDLDFIVMPEDADQALEALERVGMRPEKPPEEWLYKAYDGEALIDLIFRLDGVDISRELIEHSQEMNVLGVAMKVLCLEDMFTTMLKALQEANLDYSALLQHARSVREQVDWEEVEERTKQSSFAQAFFMLARALKIIA